MQDLWGGRGRPNIPQACPLLCLYQAKPHVLHLQKSTKLLQNLKRRILAQTSDTIIEQPEKTPTIKAPATDDIFQITNKVWQVLFANGQTVMMGQALIHSAMSITALCSMFLLTQTHSSTLHLSKESIHSSGKSVGRYIRNARLS